MKKNNRGFIAISLIYSFFLVFLVTLLMVITTYARNRILLTDVKRDTQEYLNGLAGFNNINLSKKDEDGNAIPYTNGEIVPSFASESWVVMEDLGTTVKLILARDLTADEIQKAVTKNPAIASAVSNATTTMCLHGTYHATICSFNSSVYQNPYTWSQSVVKMIVDSWLDDHALLKKTIDLNILQSMTYKDNTTSYNGVENQYTNYIRIPLNSEYDSSYGDIWYLTASATFDLDINGSTVSTHENLKGIRPVIVVKKSDS